ncbi:MAG: adenylate kinase [Actinobacteria bacterium]|nr:adenylate kinase [Actinomycetota bacterium]
MGRGPRVVLLGKQGAGKGTQAARLAEHYGIPHVSTGELLRAAAAAGTEFGKKAEEYMNRGELVPDDVVFGLLAERVAAGDRVENGFVLDGFPRTDTQAIELDRALEGHPLDIAINLDVPTETVLDRIAGRRVCENCGATYHVSLPPKKDWTCDECGGKVVQRADDTEDAVMRRLELYEQETVPIIDYYRKLGKLEVVDGEGDGDDVFKRLVTAVDSRL